MNDDFMKNYTGEIDQAAVDQPDDTNIYADETQEDYQAKVAPPETTVEPVQSDESYKQELNFKALREEIDRIKAEKETEKRDYQIQLEMLRANMNQAQQKPPEAPKKMFDGMSDNDVPNVAELRREWNEREQGYQARLEELQVQQMFPDYAEVIEKFALPLVQQKPHLAEGIQGARNKALFAYELGKMAQQMKQTQEIPTAPLKSENAQRIVDNARKPGTLSQTGGQGALSKADYYATMSDKEFHAIASRNLEGI